MKITLEDEVDSKDEPQEVIYNDLTDHIEKGNNAVWAHIRSALKLSKTTGKVVIFRMNDTEITIHQKEKPEDLDKKFAVEYNRCAKEREQQYKGSALHRFRQEMKSDKRANDMEVDELIRGVGYAVGNQDLWAEFVNANRCENGEDGLVVEIVKRTGRLMQAKMALYNRTVSEVADDAFKEADIWDLDGYMVGAAQGALIYTWAYGNELKEVYIRQGLIRSDDSKPSALKM